MKNRNMNYSVKTFLFGMVFMTFLSCERDLSDEAVDATFPKTAEIFTGTVAQARELKNITELCNLCKTRAEKAGKLPEEATSDAIQEGVEKVKDLVEQ